jgi:hypothetical protein
MCYFNLFFYDLGLGSEIWHYLGLSLDDMPQEEFVHDFIWTELEDLKEPATKKMAMFEMVVDGLFTIVDLDESNDLDREEFNFLANALKQCCVSGSSYAKAMESKKLDFDDAKKQQRGCDERNLPKTDGLTRGQVQNYLKTEFSDEIETVKTNPETKKNDKKK